MKKFFISTVFLLGLSMNAYGQKQPPHPPAPPVPSKSEMVSSKSRELDKRYKAEKK